MTISTTILTRKKADGKTSSVFWNNILYTGLYNGMSNENMFNDELSRPGNEKILIIFFLNIRTQIVPVGRYLKSKCG